MTDGGDAGDGSVRSDMSLTRRTVLQLAGITAFLSDGTRAASDTARAAADGREGRSVTRGDVAAADRTAAVGGRLGRYAAALALDGRIALVGVPPSADEPGPTDGRVAVLARYGRRWGRQTILTPVDDAGQFGRSVALDGDTAVIGGELGADPTGAHGGSAAVYTRTRGTWTRQATLDGPGTRGVDLFGTAVDVADDTLIVGASVASTDGRDSGTAFVFARNGGTWKRRATLTPPGDGIEEFGRAVAIDGKTAVVGARQTDGARPVDSGIAFVYRRRAGFWRRQATLAPPGRHRDDGFGTVLALAGKTAVVGAPTETNEYGLNAGAVHVFARRNGRWREQATLRDEDGRAARQVGTAVALDGDGLLVGARAGDGPIAFVREDDAWTRVKTLRTPDGDPGRRGSIVALDGARALVSSGVGSLEVFEP